MFWGGGILDLHKSSLDRKRVVLNMPYLEVTKHTNDQQGIF